MTVDEGVASYYTIASSSDLTASGEEMVDEAMTCAMRKGVFGAVYRVTAENGRSVVVRLNDRGPYIEGRNIDLSAAAMQALDPTMQKGLLNVKIERINESEIAPLFWPRYGFRILRTTPLMQPHLDDVEPQHQQYHEGNRQRIEPLVDDLLYRRAEEAQESGHKKESR